MQKTSHEQVAEILEKSPRVGVYAGETQADWDGFFAFFMKFLGSEQGPRGDVVRKCRELLGRDRETADRLLKVIGLHSGSNIRDIYVRHKAYTPSRLYRQHADLREKLQQMNSNAQLIRDSGSLMYKNIERGLLAKFGPGYDAAARMRVIQAEYADRHQQMRETTQMMLSELEQNPGYVEYVQLTRYLRPLTEEWEAVDRGIGNNNVERGRLFEEKCEKEGLQLLFKRYARPHVGSAAATSRSSRTATGRTATSAKSTWRWPRSSRAG